MKTNKLDIALGIIVGMLSLYLGNVELSITNNIFAGIIVMSAFMLICFIIVVMVKNKHENNNNQHETYFWQHRPYKNLSITISDEKRQIINELEKKYPKFKESNEIQKWVDLMKTMNFDNLKNKEMFLRTFEDVLKNFENENK